MPAKNIECQLAQGQIGRYLGGTNMSAEAIEQLEHHIAECEDCAGFVEEKRKSLHQMAEARHAVVEIPEPRLEPDLKAPAIPSAKAAATHSLIQAIRDKANPLAGEAVIETAREEAPPAKRYWKTLAYSAALGGVLLLMSHLTANPTALFGDRIGPARDTDTPTKNEPAKTAAPLAGSDGDPFTPELPAKLSAKSPASPNVPAATPETGGPASTSVDPNRAPAPPSTISSTSTPNQPRINVRSKRPGRITRAPRRTRPAPRPGNSIRVYDANGNPIQ